MCVPPDFSDWIEGLGIEVIPIGPEVRKYAASRPATPPPGPPSLESIREMLATTVATQFETITAAAADCDVIVAATALQFAARSVAEKMGVPYVFAAYCPRVLPSPRHAPLPLPPLRGETPVPATTDNNELWARNAARFTDLFGDAINANRASIGLAPVDDVRRYMFTDRPWLAADAALAPWPDPAQSVFQAGAWIMSDERPLSSELETFLASGEPPVYFGFGSTRAPEDLSRVMADTARALGRRALISGGWAELSIADDQPDCLAIGEANLLALFNKVAAVVHHGGAGTTTLAALAGVPQVVIPQMYDQHYWAQQVQDLGIGVALATGAPTTGSLTSALELALSADVAARARSIATAVRGDGARTAALHVVDAAAGA
jgi:vancomycin aglycone glucosyltransferase